MPFLSWPPLPAASSMAWSLCFCLSLCHSLSVCLSACLSVSLSLSDTHTHSLMEDRTSRCIGLWLSIWKATDWIPNDCDGPWVVEIQGLCPALHICLSRTVPHALWAPGPSVLHYHVSLPFTPTISSTWNPPLPYLCLVKPSLWLSSSVLCVKLCFLSQAN